MDVVNCSKCINIALHRCPQQSFSSLSSSENLIFAIE